MIKPKLIDNGIEFISSQELAERLNLSTKTIYNWRCNKVIPSDCVVKIGGKLVRYRWSKILVWINQKGD
jgi:predicted DNA-binding transcriptional regulator AlpA